MSNGFISFDEVVLGVRKILNLCPEFINNQVLKCAFISASENAKLRRDNPMNQENKLLYITDFRILLE